MLPYILLSLGIAWVAYTFLTLAVNVHRARAMKVPLIVVPVSPMNTLWIVVEPLVFRILDRLPFRLGSFGRYGRRGWHFHNKAASHVRYHPMVDDCAILRFALCILHFARVGPLLRCYIPP